MLVRYRNTPANLAQTNTVKLQGYTKSLPLKLKMALEYLSGFNLEEVRVHYNSDKPAKVKAMAYAQGTDIYLSPYTKKLLPHEAWHVVQQLQGRVEPTGSIEGLALNDMPNLEKEANIMGQLAQAMSIALNEGYIDFFDKDNT